MLHYIDMLLCLIIVLRTLCYNKTPAGTHRPLVAFVAYLIIAVAGTELIQLVFFQRATDPGGLLYKLLLALVLLKSRGNVVDLFYTREASGIVFRILIDTWDDIRDKLNRLSHINQPNQEKRTR